MSDHKKEVIKQAREFFKKELGSARFCAILSEDDIVQVKCSDGDCRLCTVPLLAFGVDKRPPPFNQKPNQEKMGAGLPGS